MPKKSSKSKKWNAATLAIHGLGRSPKAYYSVSTPIVQTSNYYFDTSAKVYEFMKAKGEGRLLRGHEYGRYGNPTQEACDRKLAAIEGAERALLFATGMSAVILTLLAYMRRNGHIIFTTDCYRQTRDFATNTLSKFGIEVSLVDPTADAIAKAIQPNTNIIFTESPTNPYLRVLDIPGIVKVAKQHQIMTIIDATMATPYNIKPLDLGVDIVIHSATKYLGGHNDLLAGVSLGKHNLLNELNRMQRMIGATPGPFTCFLLERGLKTFALRMEHHNRAGLEIARMVEAHPKIEKVWYPALETLPGRLAPPNDLANMPVPQRTALVSIRPNPFNPTTTVSFDLATSGRARVEIYDPRGTLMRTLRDQWLPVGRYEVTCDGRNEQGRAVPTGVYFVRLVTSDVTQVRKAILIRFARRSS